jgi:hypothetical protein
MEDPTTLHYLAFQGATGSGTREERNRLLAETEVIPGGWPFSLDLQQWSGIARTAHPNLRRRDPGKGNPLALARCSEPHLTARRSIAISKNAAPLIVGGDSAGCPLLLCTRHFK